MLKNLKANLDKVKPSGALVSGADSSRTTVRPHNTRDAESACKVVSHIFEYVGLCLREDKSKVKVSLFAKAFIQNILKDSVRDGINEFVMNMNDKELKLLLDEIEKDIDYRYGK